MVFPGVGWGSELLGSPYLFLMLFWACRALSGPQFPLHLLNEILDLVFLYLKSQRCKRPTLRSLAGRSDR